MAAQKKPSRKQPPAPIDPLAGLLDALTGPLGRKGGPGGRERGPVETLGFARIDHHREKRKGFPEVVFAPGKTREQIRAISARILRRSGRLLVTRTDEETFAYLGASLPQLRWSAAARCIYCEGPAASRRPLARGHVLILCGGTGDVPVAEEAALTARLLGCRVRTAFDVGVAGLHRLVAQLPALRRASVVIAVAGMEASLPSVVAGLTDKPVIAVPTSIGYGTSYGGLAALLALLNSCAAGLTVVNIDNGFGAGFAAAQMLRLAQGPVSRPPSRLR
jgi:NCAIR mutase (PurE)-related protein